MKIAALFIVLSFLITSSSTIFAQGVSNTTSSQNNTFKITRPGQGFGIDISGNGSPIGNIGFILKNVITLFFTVGGLGFTIMILWGAVDWILSGGDKEKVAGARKRITTAITGLVILSLSFTIMVVIGQITGIDALKLGVGKFYIPELGK